MKTQILWLRQSWRKGTSIPNKRGIHGTSTNEENMWQLNPDIAALKARDILKFKEFYEDPNMVYDQSF